MAFPRTYARETPHSRLNIPPEARQHIDRPRVESSGNAKLSAALAAEREGSSVVPVAAARSKHERIPLVKWARYQHERARPDLLQQWWEKWPDANPAIVTGAISGFFGLDIDSREGLASVGRQGLPPTFAVTRGDPDRCHFWLEWPGFDFGNPIIHPGVEIKGNGGLLPAPGATHWSGAPYVGNGLPIAPAPEWLLDLLRPKPRTPTTRQRPITQDDRQGLGWASRELDRVCKEAAASGPGQHFAALKQWANWLGIVAANSLLMQAECIEALEWAFEANGYAEKHGARATRKQIEFYFLKGYEHPEDFEPPHCAPALVRPTSAQSPAFTAIGPIETFPIKIDAKKRGEDSAAADESRTFHTPIFPSLGSLIKVLCSDRPKAALDMIPHAGKSRATTYRRKSRAFRLNSMMNKNESENATPSENGDTDHATPVSPGEIRLNRIRILFPQSGKKAIGEIIIPAQDLAPALFDQALSEDEIADLLAHDATIALTRKQRQAVAARQRILKRVEKVERELGDVPFIPPDEPINNLPDLRRHVLRQIVQHFLNPETGRSQLSNAVQACLLGVTPSTLQGPRGLRERAGIEQTAPPVQEIKIANVRRLPSNTRRLMIRDERGDLRQYHDPTAPSVQAAITSAIKAGRAVYAAVQPVAEQRITVMPERQPRHTPAPKPKVPVAHNAPDPDQPKPTPKRRRPYRQHYAACLMRNILHHFRVKASADEPLPALADKVRAAIKPVVEQTSREGDPMFIHLTQPEAADREIPPPSPIGEMGDPLIDYLVNDLGGTVTESVPTGEALQAQYMAFTDLTKRDDWLQSLPYEDRLALIEYRSDLWRGKNGKVAA